MSILNTRFRQSFAAHLAGQGLTVIIQLISVPVFLRFWENSYYGEWIVLQSITTLVGIAEGGFGMQASNGAVMKAGCGDWSGAQKIISANVTLQAIVVTTVALFAIPLAYQLNWASWAGLVVISGTEGKLALVALIFGVLVLMPCSLFLGLYRAEGKDARCASVVNAGRLLGFMATIVVISIGGRALHVSICILASNLTVLFVLFIDSRRSCRLIFRPGAINIFCFRQDFLGATSHQLIPLSTGLYLQGQLILVNSLLGSEAVVVINACRTLTRMACQFTYSIKNAMWQDIGLMHDGLKDGRLFGYLISRIRLSVVSTIALCVVITVVGPTFIKIWTHGNVVVDWSVVGIYSLAAAASALAMLPVGVLQALNRHNNIAVVSCISAIGGLAVTYYALPIFAVYGVALGMLTTEIINIIQSVRMMLRQMS